MATSEGYLKGIVFTCPLTKTQFAIHKNLVNFAFWDTGLAGFELDIEIIQCPGCKTMHTMSMPIQIKV